MSIPIVSYHRRKIKKKSPSRSAPPQRRSYSLRNRHMMEEDDETNGESVDDDEVTERPKARRPRETEVLKEAARECFGSIDLNVSLVDKVKERARRRARQREEQVCPEVNFLEINLIK